ncbi:MAG TPA: hypothetical protein DCM41_00915 [Synergistaceae bacterium]|nr:hypothetical protein [Synergistaceae bacterium]
MSGTRLEFLIVDPQNDFCDPKGALYVPGAREDSIRLADTIKRLRDKISHISVTLDTHRLIDIAHPIFWMNTEGRHPDPYTLIRKEDLKKGLWHTTVPDHMERAVRYVEELGKNNRYVLCIWPPHCLIGSWGHGVTKPVYDALLEWENNFSLVDYTLKGLNMWTEHYSALKADVEDPEDPATGLNKKLIKRLHEADIIAISGQALSHCVANSVRDLADNSKEEDIKKLVLLTDTTSSVKGFEKLGEDFVREMTVRGMQVSTSDDFGRNF